MELVLLPFFMPLLLLGWYFDDAERELRRREQERLEAYERTWLRIHAPRRWSASMIVTACSSSSRRARLGQRAERSARK